MTQGGSNEVYLLEMENELRMMLVAWTNGVLRTDVIHCMATFFTSNGYTPRLFTRTALVHSARAGRSHGRPLDIMYDMLCHALNQKGEVTNVHADS